MRRKLMLPLGAVAVSLSDRPAISDEELRVAREGRDLIRSMLDLEGGHELTAAGIARLDDKTFRAAHSIVEGGDENAALRLAAEEIDQDSFHRLSSRLASIPAAPDPSEALAAEFI